MSMREEVLYKVFLDPQKDYDNLNWGSFMDILLVFIIRPRMERVLCPYWGHLLVVARAEQ